MSKKQKTTPASPASAAAAAVAKPKKAQSEAGGSSPEAAASSERSEFLKLFWNLAESDMAERTQAAAKILAHLEQQAKPDNDVQYTLKRLVRGLASSRDAARQGFSTALAGLLARFPALVALKDVQELLRESMAVNQNMKGMEQREHMFGRLFGLLALHRSGRLTAQDDQTLAVQVIQELLEMAAWKKWIREACFEGVLSILADIQPQVFLTQLVPAFTTLLDGDVTKFNAEQVLLAAGLQHYIHATGLQGQVPAEFPAVHFLRRKHMHLLAEPLKSSSSCFPRVHSAWFGIFGHLLHTGKNAEPLVDSELFQETWTVLVENTLLNKDIATHERKGLALKLFELAVSASLPRPLLRSILTPHFVKCLYNNSVSKKNYLHDAARHCVQVFAAQAPEEFFHFFQKQFVKPMASLVEIDNTGEDAEADEQEDQKERAARLKSGGFDAMLVIEEERERAEMIKKKTDSARLWALDAMISAVSDQLTKEETVPAYSKQGLRFLIFHSFFTSSKATPSKKSKKKAAAQTDVGLDAALLSVEPALSSIVREHSVKRLLSLVSIKLATGGSTGSILSLIYSIAQELLQRTESVTLRYEMDAEMTTQLQTITARVQEIRDTKKPADETVVKQLEAFSLLFMSCALQLLDHKQRSDAMIVAIDLEKCFADLLSSAKKTKKSPAKKSKKKAAEPEEDAAEADQDPIVVFTDMLLSLLSLDSGAMRDIVTHVFRSVLPLLNGPSIETIVNVLAPNDDEIDGDVDNEPIKRKRQDGEDEDEDEDMEADEAEEEDEIVLTSATEVSEALRSDAKLADLHREDMALAAIVGQVKDRAKRKSDAKQMRLQQLHFQLRVLDLLQVFVTHSSESEHVLLLVVPLFQALVKIQKTDNEKRVLSERLQSVLLNKLLRAKDVPSIASKGAVRESTLESLAAIVEILRTKTIEKDLSSKVGTATVLYLVRALCGKPDTSSSDMEDVRQILRPVVLEAFTKKHARFPRAVFDDLITKFPTVAVHLLLEPLTTIATTAKQDKDEKAEDSTAALDEFSACEVLRLLSLLLKPKLLANDSERKPFHKVQSALTKSLVTLLSAKDKELKAKRMKIVLAFALHLVRASIETAKNADKARTDLKELIAALEALESSSPVVKQFVKMIVDVHAGKAAPEPKKKDASKKKPTKRKRTTTE